VLYIFICSYVGCIYINILKNLLDVKHCFRCWGYTREEIQIVGENGLSLTFEILVCVLFFSLHWLFLIMGVVFLIMGIILDILSHCDE